MTLAVLPAPSNHTSVQLFASSITPPLVLARTTGVVILVVNVGSAIGAFRSSPVFKRFTVGYFVVLVSIVVFSLFATSSGT